MLIEKKAVDLACEDPGVIDYHKVGGIIDYIIQHNVVVLYEYKRHGPALSCNFSKNGN